MFAQVPHHVGIGEGKNMNKLLKNKWFVRLISFFIALMLYTVVSAEQPPGAGSHKSSGGGNGKDEPEQLDDVKLVAYYDDDQYILSDLPETVSVQLEGSESSITKASLSNSHEVFVDLTDKGAGTHTVSVQTRGFPKDLTVHTTPAKVKVSLQEKETKKFPVQINLINEGQVADGYVASKPETDPTEVAITAGKQAINRIAFVEGFVDVKDADDTVKETVSLNVYDNKGNELDVETDPSKVGVIVPVEQSSKTVAIQVDQKGSLPDGLNMKSFDLKSDEATLYGPKDVLDDIDAVHTSLDLSKIKKDSTVELDVTKPKDVNKITPEKVEADVHVTDEATKTIHDVPIDVTHLPDGLDVSFLKPEDKSVDVILTGAKKDLDNIKKSDVKASINADGLSTGEHSPTVEISDLKNVEAHPQLGKAKVEVTEEGE